MAYLPKDPNQEEDQDPNAPGAAPGVQGGSGASSVISGSAGAALPGEVSAQANSGAPKASGSFTNLNKYLQTNTDASANLGNQIGSKISGAGQQALGTVNQTKDQFINDVNADQYKVDKGFVSGLVGSGKQASDDDLNKFTGLFNAKVDADYETSQGYGDALDQIGKAKQKAQAASSEEGRFGLLQDEQKTRNQGITSLNNLFLQGNDARQNIANSVQSVNDLGLDDQLAQAAEAARGTVDTARGYIDEGQTFARDAVTGQKGSIQDRIAADTSQYKTGLTAAEQALEAKLKGGLYNQNALNETEMRQAGLRQNDIDAYRSLVDRNNQYKRDQDYLAASLNQVFNTRSYGYDDVGDYVTSQDISGNTYVTPEMLAQANALRQLAGIAGVDASDLASSSNIDRLDNYDGLLSADLGGYGNSFYEQNAEWIQSTNGLNPNRNIVF